MACGRLKSLDAWRLLEVLGDRYSLMIIIEALKRPVCAPSLARLGIPPATAYRRLEALARAGLLEPRGFTFTGKGRWAACYTASFKSMTIRISGDGLKIEVE